MSELDKKNILVCKVSYNWYQVLKSHYISNGSSATNCWYTKDEEIEPLSEDRMPDPGTLTLFVVEVDGVQKVVGGAFFLTHWQASVKKCWDNFGVCSGYITYEDFSKRAQDCGASLGDLLSCYVCYGPFIFMKNNIFDLPDSFQLDFSKSLLLTLDENDPLTAFLVTVSMQRRASQIDAATSEGSWRGIYYLASLRQGAEDAAILKTKILNLYNFKCAISGCRLGPTLSVAHIKTMYDDRYTEPQNAILMRSDLHKLFAKGYITIFYDDNGDCRVRVSRKILLNLDPEYSKFEGAKLELPNDKKYWPNPEYLEWHNRIRFENWLKYGEFSLIDHLPMHPHH